jgi:hypothetical protein
VTKPIELGARKADLSNKSDLPTQSKIEKAGPPIGRQKATNAGEPCPEAKIMDLAPMRARKTSTKPEIFVQIGARLGRVYNDVLQQPVPDRFLDLLQALETGPLAEPDCPALPVSPSDPHISSEHRIAGGKKKESK